MSGSLTIPAPKFPVLYPKQYDALFDPARIVVIEASTKAGKTVGCIIWEWFQAWLPIQDGIFGRHYCWMAPVNSKAMELGFEGFKKHLRQWNGTREFWRDNISKQFIDLYNPYSEQTLARFRFVGADNPDSVYGSEHWGAVVDEASRCSPEAWHALRTTTTSTKGPIRAIGNVKNRSTWMYKLGEKARSGSKNISYHKLTVYDALEGGRQIGVPIVDEDEIEFARETLPKHVFERDYMAVPMDDGSSFFNAVWIEHHRKHYAREGRRMRFDEGGKELVDDPGGKWWCWFDTVPDRTNFVLGVDIAQGAAGSNSVIAVMDRTSREVIAEYVDPYIYPEDLAALCRGVGEHVFSGDRHQALVVWEANGPGEGWFRHFLTNGYSALYFQRREGSRGERLGRRYGWHSTRPLKIDRLGMLRSSMACVYNGVSRIKVLSEPCLDEMGRYIYMDDGSVGPDTQSDTVSGARANHGDRVIAVMMALMGVEEVPAVSLPKKRYKKGTYGHLADHDLLEQGHGLSMYRDPFGKLKQESLGA